MYRSGWTRIDGLRSDFERLLDELAGGPTDRGRVLHELDSQSVPINVFETDTELVIVAAMPGIESANVEVQVDDSRLTVRGDKRGPGQEHLRYLTREWTYGPYERTIELPPGLDVDRANAAYGNGVVTVAFPKAAARRTRRIEINADPEKSGQKRPAA